MGPLRIAGLVIAGLGVAVGLYVIGRWVFPSTEEWTAEEMDTWMLTSILGFVVGVALFFWPQKNQQRP